jgi:hypothetical protein
MEKAIASAAKWPGICMVISTLILVWGLKSIARRQPPFPNDLTVRLQLPKEIQLAPVEVSGGSNPHGGAFEVNVRP